MATLGDIFGNSGPAIGDYGGAIGDRTMGGVNPAPKKKIDWWKVAGVLGDALQATGGGQGTYLPMLQQQRLLEQQDQRDWDKAEREYGQKVKLYDYQSAHPRPKESVSFGDWQGMQPDERAAFLKYEDAVNPKVVTTPWAGTQNVPRSAGERPIPTPQDINDLVAHPELAGQFDAKFGDGLAKQYMGVPNAR